MLGLWLRGCIRAFSVYLPLLQSPLLPRKIWRGCLILELCPGGCCTDHGSLFFGDVGSLVWTFLVEHNLILGAEQI